jgi:hypothetical protein
VCPVRCVEPAGKVPRLIPFNGWTSLSPVMT